MARRSDHSREELAALVIGAAHEITAHRGWREATMRRIAAQIGYSPGSIYNAVGDMDIVLLRMNAATLEGLADRFRAVLGRNGRPGAAVASALALADEYMTYVADHPRLWAALLEHPPSPDRPVPDWYLRARDQLFEMVSAALAPLFPDAKSRYRAVVALWSALQGVAALTLGGNLALAAGGLNPAQIARSIVSRYLSGHE